MPKNKNELEILKKKNGKKAVFISAAVASAIVTPITGIVLNEKNSKNNNISKAKKKSDNNGNGNTNTDSTTDNNDFVPTTNSTGQKNSLQADTKLLNVRPFTDNTFKDRAKQWFKQSTNFTDDQINQLIIRQQQNWEKALSTFSVATSQNSTSKHLELNLSSGFQPNFLDEQFWRQYIQGYNKAHSGSLLPESPWDYLLSHVRLFYTVGNSAEVHYLDEGRSLQGGGGLNHFDLGDITQYGARDTNGNLMIPDVTVYVAFDNFTKSSNSDKYVGGQNKRFNIPTNKSDAYGMMLDDDFAPSDVQAGNGQSNTDVYNWWYSENNLEWISNFGASYTFYGGNNPSDVFKGMSDYNTTYAPHINTPDVGQFATLMTSGDQNKGQENPHMDRLNNVLKDFTSNLTYSGTTAVTHVHIGQNTSGYLTDDIKHLFDWKYNDNDHGDIYPDGVYPHFYYSIDNGTTINKIDLSSRDFDIVGLNQKAIQKNGVNQLPVIQYYYAISKDDNAGRPLIGYNGGRSSTALFNYVGAKQDVETVNADGTTKTPFQTIKDIIMALDAPIPKDDATPQRSVTETNAYGLIHSTKNGDGSIPNSPLIAYKYRIKGGTETDWKSASDFFGTNKLGSTSEALSTGVEWEAFPTNGGAWGPSADSTTHAGAANYGDISRLLTLTLPSGAIQDGNYVKGEITWNIPTVTKIDAPTVTASSSIDWTLNLPTDSAGIDYSFSLVDPDTNKPITLPNGTTKASVSEFASWSGPQKNLYIPSTGKYYNIVATGTPLNASSSVAAKTFVLKVTTSSLPTAAVPAIVKVFDDSQKPSLDANSTDTGHIKINLSPNNPFNFTYSIGSRLTNLHVNANGFLVNAAGQMVNSYSNTKSSITYALDLVNPTKSNSNVTYDSNVAVTGNLSTNTLAKYIKSWTSTPNITNDSNTIVFGINEGDSDDVTFPVPLEYSLNGTDWYSKTDFLAVTQNGDNLFASTVFGGTRNLYDDVTKTFKTIMYRTKPNSNLSASEKYVIDVDYAKAQHLTQNKNDGSWHGTISTSTLPIAIQSQVFEQTANIPTLTGTNSLDYVINAPTVAHMHFEFKISTEAESLYTTAENFKKTHNSLNIQTSGIYSVQTIEWRAVADSGYTFVDSATNIKNIFVDSMTNDFIPQTLVPVNPLAATIPHNVSTPVLSGTTTKDVSISVPTLEEGETYYYSVSVDASGSKIWKTFDNFDGSQIIGADGFTLKNIDWEVRFTAPHVAAEGQVTSGVLSTSNIKLFIGTLNPPTASLFKGVDSLNWTVDSQWTAQPGVTYYIYIGDDLPVAGQGVLPGQKFTLAALKKAAGTINLFNQAKNAFKQIHWSATNAANANSIIDANLARSGIITLGGMKKYLETIAAPQLNATSSNDYSLTENSIERNEVTFSYSIDQSQWWSADEFKSHIGNLYDIQMDSVHQIYWKAISNEGYIIASSATSTGIITPASDLLKIGNQISKPQITGTTSVSYNLPDSAANGHAKLLYKLNSEEDIVGNWLDAAAFKTKHQNLWNQASTDEKTSWDAIDYKVESEAGFNYSGSGTVGGLNNLTRIIEVDKIVTPIVVATSGTTKSFTPTAENIEGVIYKYSTDQSADIDTFVSLDDLIQSEGGNLFDGQHLKDIYYVPAIKPPVAGKSTAKYAFDKTPVAKKVDISSLIKVISTLVPPVVTSSDNKTNNYSLTPSTQLGVDWTYYTSGDNTPTTFDDVHGGLPNLFTGNVTYSLFWKATAQAGYQIDSTIQANGNFDATTKNWIKVYDSNTQIPKPSLSNVDPNHYEFNVPVTAGVEYKFFIGSEQPMTLADFHNAHSTIYDSTTKRLYVVKYQISATGNYAFKSTIATTGDVDLTSAQSVITDVITPVISPSSKNSHNFSISIHTPTEVNTQFRLNNSNGQHGPWVSLVALLDDIKTNHNDNLYDQATKTWLSIEWKISPTNPNVSLDPATSTNGHVEYKVNSRDLDKFVVSSTPIITGTSSKTSNLIVTNESDAFDYTYGLKANEKLTWTAFIVAHPNIYNSLLGTWSSIMWQATPKLGFASDATSDFGTIDLSTANIPAFIDSINPLQLTGSSTEDYSFTGTTNGVSYLVSDSQNGTFVTPQAFKADSTNSNIANKTLWYKVVSTDPSKFIVDPSIVASEISSNLAIAIASLAMPTLDSAHNTTNDWELLATTANVSYEFSIPALKTGWLSLANLKSQYGDKIFDDQKDIINSIVWQATANDKYIFSQDVTTTSGVVDLSSIIKYVSNIATPTLHWADKNSQKSTNYTINKPTKSADYSISIDGGATYTPVESFVPINLYDAATGLMKPISWKATPKSGYHGAKTAWTGVIAATGIKIKVINAVSLPTITGTTSSFTITGTTPNVDYYIVDTSDQTPTLESITDFVAHHLNLFNSTSYTLDTIKYVVKPKTSYELSGISNNYDAGIAGASLINIDALKKVIDRVLAPTLGGTANSWNVTEPDSNGAYTYAYRLSGTNDSYVDEATLKSTHPSLDFGGKNYDLDWQANPSTNYSFKNGISHEGTLSALTSSLEILLIAAPVINFSDSHDYSVDASSFTSNVTYKFKLEGEADTKLMEFAAFKTAHSNLFDAQTDTIKNIVWSVTPKTINTQVFHIDSSAKTSDTINTQQVTKYIETIAVPTLQVSNALSTAIDLDLPEPSSNYVNYTYQIDGGIALTLDQLKTAYASLSWDNSTGQITVLATAKTGYKFGAQDSSTIDTTSVVKVINPALLNLTSDSSSTSDYAFEATTRIGLNYRISIDGTTYEDLSAFLASKNALYTVAGGLKTVSWTVELSDSTKFAFATNATTSGTIDISSLAKVIDIISAPTLGGTDSTDYTLTIDPLYDGVMGFEYSLDNSANAQFMSYDDFKTNAQNIYSKALSKNQVIYARPIVLNNAQFGTTVKTLEITTNQLICVIDDITKPVLTTDVTTTSTSQYNVIGSQTGVDYTYSTSSNGTFESFADFVAHHANLYHLVIGTWTTQNIYWKANVSTTNTNSAIANQKFKFSDNVIDHGFIDTQALTKIIDSLPIITTTGTTQLFSAIDNTTKAAINIPGITITYSYDGKDYTSLSDLISKQVSGFNLWNIRTNALGTITYTITPATGYGIASTISASGTVLTTGLKKVVDYINTTNWVPVVASGSDQWNYNFTERDLPTYLSQVFTYEYSTNENAADSEWKSFVDFKTSNLTLLNSDGTNKHVFYRIKLSGNYDFAQGLSSNKGEVSLPFATTISNVLAPTIEDIGSLAATKNYTSRVFNIIPTTSHVIYKYRFAVPTGTPENQFVSFDQFKNIVGINLYDAATNGYKNVEWQATPEVNYTFNKAMTTSGNVDVSNKDIITGNLDLSQTNIAKVIESFVSPELSATDSLSYSLVPPIGKVLTKGLVYKLTIGSLGTYTIDEWIQKGVNLFDVANNRVRDLSWSVTALSGYSLIASTTHGILTPPVDMVKVIDTISAPTIGPKQNSANSPFSTASWAIKESNANGFNFEYSIDGVDGHWYSKSDLAQHITNGNFYDNQTGTLVTLRWRAIPTDANYSISAALKANDHGNITFPSNMKKAIDVLAAPTIAANTTSDNYTFIEPTSNVLYEYKLENEPDSKYLSKDQFIAAHPNLYNETENAGHLFEVNFRITAKRDYILTTLAKPKTGSVDTSTIVTYVISNIEAATAHINATNNATTTHYTFDTPSKFGVVYKFGSTENGPWYDFEQYKNLTSNINLFDATNGLEHVYWHVFSADPKYQISASPIVGEINIDSLTKIVDVSAGVPQFTDNSNTNAWDFKPLDSSIWIDHYEFATNDDVEFMELDKFKTVHHDLNTEKDNNNIIIYVVHLKPGYAAGTGTNFSGQFTLQKLNTKLDTSSYNLSNINFFVNPQVKYGVENIPTISGQKFHIAYAWGDKPDKWISPSSTEWQFGTLSPWIEPEELWNNRVDNGDGTFGAWNHNGKITFKLVPNDPQDTLTDDKAFEYNFANTDLLKIILNRQITVNEEIHTSGEDAHFAYLPKYTQDWNKDTNKTLTEYLRKNNLDAGDGSDSLLPIINHWIEDMNHNTDIQINPFESMNSSAIDTLLNSFDSSTLKHLQGLYPEIFPNTISIDQLKATFRNKWLSYAETTQFFYMLGDMWTGSNWRIQAISIRPHAYEGFTLVNESPRVVWNPSINTIAKVTDNQAVINEIIAAIKPADQPNSVNDNVIWGDQSQIQQAVIHALQQHLKIQLAATFDQDGNPIWKDLNPEDANDFFNTIKVISLDHTDRKLMLQVFSTDIDAATGAQVKVTNANAIDITQDSGIQRVKTKITSSGKYNPDNIKVTGFTDGDIQIDDSIVTETYLEVSYTIPQYANQGTPIKMTKDELIAKIAELRQQGVPVYGEDIIAKIDLKDSMSKEYSLGEDITGHVDYSKLYTHKEITETQDINKDYVKALTNDIALDGKALDNASSTQKTVYITLAGTTLISPDFTSYYGIQYKINDGNWELFTPEKTDLAKNPSQNIVQAHNAGTYMAVRMIAGDVATFRVVPIATAKGEIVITNQDANHSQKYLMEKTRVATNDWDGTDASQGTLVVRKTNDLLSVGENELIQSINDNLDAVQKAQDQGHIVTDDLWLQPFLSLVSSRPKYEDIQDATIDKGLFNAGALVDFTKESTINDLKNRGIISASQKDEIANVIAQLNVTIGKQVVPNNPDGTPGHAYAWNPQTGETDSGVTNGLIIMALNFNKDLSDILNNIHEQDEIFNRDLIQTGSSSFEISQIGRSGVNQDDGLKFTHSNTIFFGANAIRFNALESNDKQTNSIVDAYFVGEDSVAPERIAKIHLSTEYSLKSMSIVLELTNGYTIYLNKDIDSASNDEVVRMVRLDSKVSSAGKILPTETYGANWLYASESLLNKNIASISVENDSSLSTANEPLNLSNDTLRKTVKHWVASKDELDAHTSANEMPFNIGSFDNGNKNNAIVLAVTPLDTQETNGTTSNGGSIYRNEVSTTSKIFKADTAVAQIYADATPTKTLVVNFTTNDNFSTSQRYINEELHELILNDSTNASSDKTGYVVVKSEKDSSGGTTYKKVSQNASSIFVDKQIIGGFGDGGQAKKSSFPTWAIIIATLGSVLTLAGAMYLWYTRRQARKAAQIKRPTIKIRRRK